jgi:prepilin-type N-terminal cleavage/methylation domain-containing protein
MKGFTLIEFVVALGIMALLSLLILPNYHYAGKTIALKQSTMKLGQDLRRAEEMAMSAKEFNGAVPPGGYGLYFDQTNNYYILYADCNADYQYNPTATSCNNNTAELVERVDLDTNLKIYSLSPSPLYIVFTAPQPTVYIPTGVSSATIILSLKDDANKNKTIKVNKNGLIEVPFMP